MALCVFCGENAGFWSWQHAGCAAKREVGRAKMVDMVAEAVLQPRKRSRLSARLAAVASRSFLSVEPLKTFYAQGWEKAAEAVLAARSPDDEADWPQIAAEDELVTFGEYGALYSFIQRFGLDPEEVNARGAYTRIVRSVLIRNVLEGEFPTPSSRADELPVVLQKGETLVWRMWDAEYVELRTHTFYVGASQGFSIRIMKGVYYRRSRFRGQPVSLTGPETVGIGPLFLTDKNLYFVSFEKTVRINYDKVIGLIPFTDGFALYTDGRSGKPQAFQTGDGWFACNLLANLIWQRRDGVRRQPLAPPAPGAHRGTPRQIEQRAQRAEEATRAGRPHPQPQLETADARGPEDAGGAAGARGAGSRTGMYTPLRDYLEAAESDYITLSFDDVATIIGRPLPASAYRHNAWWANNYDHVEARAWMDAGWRTEHLSLTAERVTFVRG